MEKVYKSEVSIWYLSTCVFLTASFIGSIFLCCHTLWVLLIDVISCGIGIALLLDILFHTDYTIKKDTLYIRCGIIYRQTLPISKITEITHNTSLISSPALSANRIEIKYGKSHRIYISPKYRSNFITTLKSINPQIATR